MRSTAALFASSLFAAAALTACSDRPAPEAPILESTTTSQAALGFDDPTVVADDALTTLAAGAREPWVVVTIFADLQCPFCTASPRLADRVLSQWPDEVQVHFRHLPLTNIHPHAQAAAVAVQAAHRQGEGLCVEEALYKSQRHWTRGTEADFVTAVDNAATLCGAELQRLHADMGDPAIARKIRADASSARALGVRGTPTLLVNGFKARPILRPGGKTSETLIASIRRELRLADVARAEGIPRADFLRDRVGLNTGDPRAAAWLLGDEE